MIDYTLILTTKYKGTLWTLDGDSYEGLTWLSESPKPTKKELDSQWEEALIIIKKQNCKEKTKQLIAKYDFAVLPDRSKDIQNINDIISYRNSLLSLIKNPIENPEFPTPPEIIWK